MFAVVGTFNEDGGKPSSVGAKLIKELGIEEFFNGGTYESLKNFDFSKHDVVLWMPNIPNEEEKILPRLKAKNRKMIVISSKRMRDEYEITDLIGRLLKVRSNLGIAIYDGDRFSFKLIDPLGNIYAKTEDLSVLAAAITKRVEFLQSITRVPSNHGGEEKEFVIRPMFIDVIKQYGEKLSGCSA